MSDRYEATFVSPTGGYVVVALVDDGGDGWRHLVDTLLERGYVLSNVDGERSPRP